MRCTVRRKQDPSPHWSLTANTPQGIAASIWDAFIPHCSTLSWTTLLWMSSTWCCVLGMCCFETSSSMLDSRDHACREHRGEDANHLRQLEQAIRSCAVSFQIWQKREPTGKPIPGSYDWTALTGKHKLQVLKMLPEKMSLLLPDTIFLRIAALWRVGVSTMIQI